MTTEPEPQTSPWYRLEIGQRLKPPVRKLLESYSGLAPDDVESHLHAVRDRAWSLQKYPCIGQWSFLGARTPAKSYYQEMITRLKAGASILDIGCCFGQDLRYLAADGAPTERMYASDIVPELWDISYEMYRDLNRMKARFILADILDPASPLMELRGKMDILMANSLFHLFDWEGQVKAGETIVALSRPGALLVGRHIGSSIGMATPISTATGGGIGSADSKTRFRHDTETWQEMWREIQKQTGTEWKVESSLHLLGEPGMKNEDYAWMGPHARVHEFIVRRVG